MSARTTIKRQLRRAKVKQRLRGSRVRRAFLTVVCALVAAVLFVTLLPASVLTLAGLPNPRLPVWGQGVRIYDRRDRLSCTIYGERDQQPVHLSDVSPNLQHAIIAAEDHDFYMHDGINPVSILRAFLVDVSAHHALQGGSTLSQQLIKNLYFEGKKRNLIDKAEEAVMALQLEHRYSKQQILEAYLNCVYFGQGVFGAERAAQQYFGKHAAQLDLAQSAFIAGLVTAPSELSQPAYRKQAIERQHLILDSIAELHFADAAAVKRARAEKLVFRTSADAAVNYKHYTSEVLNALRRQFGDDQLFARGFRVYTYMDPQAQALAERVLSRGIRKAPSGINQGALVSISVADGGIIAMVGGAGSYDRNQWNRALSPHTAGSAFKPFVYLAGLESGVLTPDTVLDDSPIDIQQAGAPDYKPRNYDRTYLGPITIRKALALSRNVCAVKVAQEVGVPKVIDTARRAGITSHLDPVLSLALGSSAVTPLEMANAYATLARGGIYMDALMIRRIEDSKGHVLQQNNQASRRVFDGEPVAELVDALQDVVQKGTGTRARLFDRPVAGKTGTSDAAKDIWFVGFTPDLVTAVWGGNDDNKPVPGHVTGGSVMAGIWQQYMQSFYKIHPLPPGEFTPPEHPLMQEPDAIHFLPTPADIFNRLFGPLMPKEPGVREYHWPAPAPDRAVSPPVETPRQRHGFWHRLKNWFVD